MLIELLAEKSLNTVLLIVDDFLTSINFDIIYQHFLVLFDIFLDILSYVYFFLPVYYLLPLITIVFTVIGIRITISIFRFVFSLLDAIPFIG